MTCRTCKKVYPATDDLPEDCISMECNWCPECEEKAEAPYEESMNFDPETIKYLKRCKGLRLEYCYSCKRYDLHHDVALVKEVVTFEGEFFCNHYINFNYTPIKR